MIEYQVPVLDRDGVTVAAVIRGESQDAIDGAVRELTGLSAAVVRFAATVYAGTRPIEPVEPTPVQDLHLWVLDVNGQGIAGARVTAPDQEARTTSGEGHTHFAVTGPAAYTIEAAGFLAQTVTLGPSSRVEVRLERVAVPVPEPGPTPALSRLTVESNARWFAAGAERFDWREISSFALYARWLRGQYDECRALVRILRSEGCTVFRVILSLDGDYWRVLRCAPDMPGFWEQLVPFTRMLASEGAYVRLVALGDLEPFGGVPDWTRRPDIFTGDVQRRAQDFCEQVARVVADEPNVVIEFANEPIQIGMRDSLGKLVALGRRVKAAAPQTLLCGGAADGDNDQDVTLVARPFDFCDAHIERLMGMGGFQWVKRSGEYAPIDKESQPVNMPFVSGEPVNFGEPRADGRTGDVETSPAVAFCYGAVSRVRQYNTCFHGDFGLWATLPKPETMACLRAWQAGLNAIPMQTGSRWRGHWAESFFRADIYPQHDDDRTVLEHVRGNRGPWRVYGCGDYAVTICEPAGWDYRRGLKDNVRVELVADEEHGGLASRVYRRI